MYWIRRWGLYFSLLCVQYPVCGEAGIFRSYQAMLYASICYREGASLESGATKTDVIHYYAEMKQEMERLILESDSPRLKPNKPNKIDEGIERYSIKNILECAQRNFTYLSINNKKWFDVIHRQAIPENEIGEIFSSSDRLHQKLFESQLIFIGNTHTVALEDGEVLFQLARYFTAHGKRPPGFIGEHPEKPFDHIFPLFKNIHSHNDLFQHLFRHSFIEGIYRSESPEQKEIVKWFHLPRLEIESRYAMIYPELPISGMDTRDTSTSEELWKKVGAHPWFVFFGEGHSVNVGTTKQSAVKKKGVRTFVISQYGGETNLGIERGKELLYHHRKKLLSDVIEKYGFPVTYPNNEEDPQEAFFKQWQQLISKYNALHFHNEPLYLEGADHADLVIIRPSQVRGETFDFNLDETYLFLKNYLEEIN